MKAAFTATIKAATKMKESFGAKAVAFAAKRVDPLIEEVCDRYQIDFLSGMGVYFFCFPHGDVREQILRISSGDDMEERRSYELPNLIDDMERFPEEKWDFDIQTVRDQAALQAELIDMYEVLATDTGLGECANIGHFCNDYTHKEKT